jgi:predicted nucleic acid-binding protein
VFEGNEALLLDLGMANLCELVSSEYVLEEAKRALSNKAFNLGMDEQAFVVSYLHRCVRIYPSPNLLDVRKRAQMLDDKRDIPVLTSYEMLQCDFIVTGDKEILRKVKAARRTRELLRMILGPA